LNLLAQRWLGHSQALGGAAEILFFSHRQKQPEVTNQTEIDHG
jgi:hypothetical protein